MGSARSILIVPNHSVGRSSDELFLESAEADLVRQIAPEFVKVDIAAFAESQGNETLAGRVPRSRHKLYQLNVLDHERGTLAKVVNYLAATLLIPFAIGRYGTVYIFSPGYCAIIASLWCVLLRRNYGYYVRGTWLTAGGKTPAIWHLLFSNASFIIATGEAFRVRLSRINSRVVNEVPLTKLRPSLGVRPESRGGRGRLMFAGRLAESKGVSEILRSVAKLRARGYLGVEVILAGGGSATERSAISALAATLNIEKWVAMPGHLSPDQLGDLYRTSDVFVFPSYFPEGFPRVLYEAMMLGTPIVTTRMPGLEGFLVDGKNCLYCESRNHTDVSDKVARLLDDPSLASRLSRTAYSDVTGLFQTFEHRSHAEQLLHFAA